MEKHEERKFRAWCAQRGYKCLKLRLNEQRGFPDRTVITPQKVFFMEFKTPTGRISPQQEYWLEELSQFPCCKVFVPRSCQEAIDWIESQLCPSKLRTVTTDHSSPSVPVKSYAK